ncbi:MAG: AAA family ATPase [Ruminococcus sp.]|nr:AAA family ATPase [Ruminococcus sp.]
MPVIENNVDNEEVFVPRLIILRGSPGVGKSTISSKICALNSAKKKTLISVDAMQHLDLRTPSKNKEKLGIKHSAMLASSFLAEGFDVVIDYVFDDINDLNNVIDLINNSHNNSLHYYLQVFFLDAPIEKVVKRNQSRSGKRGEYMNTSLLRKLYERVSISKGTVPYEFIINTAPLSAKQTARAILSCSQAYVNGYASELIDVKLPEADIKRALEEETD